MHEFVLIYFNLCCYYLTFIDYINSTEVHHFRNEFKLSKIIVQIILIIVPSIVVFTNKEKRFKIIVHLC
jgi:hypothetical protein